MVFSSPRRVAKEAFVHDPDIDWPGWFFISTDPALGTVRRDEIS